jgi:hypothetical protein
MDTDRVYISRDVIFDEAVFPFSAPSSTIAESSGGTGFDLTTNCNTSCYGSPNLSLITIISGLVMHDAAGLSHSESSPRHF